MEQLRLTDEPAIFAADLNLYPDHAEYGALPTRTAIV